MRSNSQNTNPNIYFSSSMHNANKITATPVNTMTNNNTPNYQTQVKLNNFNAKSSDPKPLLRTDLSFYNHKREQSISKPVKLKHEPHIYGTGDSNYLLKMKHLSLNQQYLQQQHNYQNQQQQYKYMPPTQESRQNCTPQTSKYTSSSLNTRYSKSNLDMTAKQEAREKFFADYIKANGDAASQIIPNFLFIGGHRSVNNVPNLVADKITHVLNMAGELNLDMTLMQQNNIRLLNIMAKDSKTYNIRRDFDQAFEFLDDCLKSRGQVIVNCARGISRSGAIVIAYLMFRYSMSLMDSYNFIISLRPQVRPNSYFRKQLEIYEHELAYSRFKSQFKNKSFHEISDRSVTNSQIKM